MRSRPGAVGRAALVLALAGLVVYARGLSVARYGDDLGFIADDPAGKLFYYFVHDNPNHGWYRPIEASLLMLVQACCGLDTLPLHLLQLALHIALAVLVFRAACELGLGTPAAWLAAVYCLAAQSNAIAVASNDTFSQVCGALGGWVAVGAVCRAVGGETLDRRWYAIGLVAYAVSLWSKESSVGFLVCLALVLALRRRSEWRRTLALVAPFLLLTVCYLVIRSQVVPYRPSFGEEGYDFRIGANVPRNAVMLGLAALAPVSSITIVGLVRAGAVVPLGLVSAATLAVVVAVASGWRDRGPRVPGALLLLALASLSPVLLLNHVSELYVYNALPPLSLVIGGGLAGCLERMTGGRRGAVTAGIALLFAAHLLAVEGKLAMMQDNGRRAGLLLEQLEPLARGVPPEGRLLLLNPPSPPKYSVYLLPGFNVLKHGLMRIPQLVGRNDLAVRIVEPGDPLLERLEPSDLLVTLAGERVVVRRRPEG